MSRPEWQNTPNRITLSRVALALVLFALLALELGGVGLFPSRAVALWVAAAVFVLCVSTDWVDGWLARRTGQVSTFGRIADPFADKLLVLGTLVFMIELSSLIPGWFVVVILAREFLISGLRSFLESQGIPFGARWGGKIKMVLQSVMIPEVLVHEALVAGGNELAALRVAALVLIYATLAATLISMFDYIAAARHGVVADRGDGDGGGPPGGAASLGAPMRSDVAPDRTERTP